MKNIHVIPTDKPTGIFKSGDNLLFSIINKVRTIHEGFHIYITNDEDIKEGDWCLDIKRNIIFQSKRSEIGTSKKIPIIICTYEGCYIQKDCKKIILTTDQDLIKDGVQAIDDDFLEWFVKNPSCEVVEVEKGYAFGTFYKIIIPIEERKKNFYCGDEVDYDDKCLEQCDRCVDATGVDYGYLPEEIQPQQIWNEEKMEGVKKLIQKQKFIDMMEQDEQLGLYEETKCYCGHTTTCDCGPEQETLEEAGVAYAKTVDQNHTSHMLGFLNGAKWQKDQYTIEEQHIERSIGELEKEYIKGFNDGSKRQQDKICDSEVLQRIRASKSDAEARRIIRTL